MSTDDEPAEDPANPAASFASSHAGDPGTSADGPASPADDAAGPAGPSAAGAPRARGIGRQGSYSKGIARRREILDRAIEVFRDRGADGTSLRRIAEAIGVSHGALLHYFSSREELLVAVYEHAERRRDLDRLEREGPGALDDELAVGDAGQQRVERRAPARGQGARAGQPGAGREPVGRDRVVGPEQPEQRRAHREPGSGPVPGRG